jgi:hypothetical protein
MEDSNPLFFDNHVIYAETYALEYAKVRLNHPYLTIEQSMIAAKQRTNEYLYFLLRDLMPKEKKIWPRGFKS